MCCLLINVISLLLTTLEFFIFGDRSSVAYRATKNLSRCYYYYYYGYVLAKGFYYYSSGYEYKPGHFNKQKLLPCPMLCFSHLLLALPFLSLSSDDIISVEGYPTHIISPALLLAFASLSLPSDDIISVEGYPTHIISPALLLAFDLSLSPFR